MRFSISSSVLLLLIAILRVPAFTQIQIGTVRGIVLDSSNAILTGAQIVLESSIGGHKSATSSDDRGSFEFNNVPFASYIIRVSAAGFKTFISDVSVRSNLPVNLNIRLLPVGAVETVEVQSSDKLVDKSSTGSEIELREDALQRNLLSIGASQLQQLIASAPGWTTENNGLLHIRGVDDGILYVIDGIPTADRVDALSGGTVDTEAIQSLRIITGNIPAEFGGRGGAVIILQPKSGIGAPLEGSAGVAAGSFQARELSFAVDGGIKNRFGISLISSAIESNRFLDPVDPRNFNNRGGAIKLSLRSDWHPSSRDILLINIALDGTDFRVPNDLFQEIARQRQHQRLRDNSQSLSWERIWSPTTVSNLAFFHRYYESRLIGSSFDTPIFADQSRNHAREGVVASLTHSYGRHILKGGFEAARLTPDESLLFAVTDPEEAQNRAISEKALAFDVAHPFIFNDRKARGQASAYLQDQFTALKNLTVQAGVRYDHSSLLVSDQQLSPRLGAVYFIPGSRTAFRGSFNRLYQPPQIENLLLSASEQARSLSPFASTPNRGGAAIRPEKISAYEAGFSQDLFGFAKLDSAYWYRSFRNFDDPNVFFSTTIIFPNSVSSGFARGIDVRLDVPDKNGWSGFASYTNQRILQTGPINGGLFLTDDFVEIGPGTRFIPDHDQRNIVAFGISYHAKPAGLIVTFSGRHESGVPIEVDADKLKELKSAPGADLVDFNRGRVKPWTVLDFSAGVDLIRKEHVTASAEFNIENIADHRFAYNFGNPFEGTHFGQPRVFAGHLKLSFR